MSEIIGNKLKKILKRKGINAKEFGEMIGKSELRVYQYYNATKFDSDQIIEFSNIFKVPITYWFDDDCQLNQSIVNGDGSAASVYGNATAGIMADQNKEIEHLMQLLSEIERLIQVLMNKKYGTEFKNVGNLWNLHLVCVPSDC